MLNWLIPLMDDDFIALERAARDSAFSLGNQILPTQAKREADDYRKGFVRLHGLDIAIENPRGSVRSGKTADGREWANVMAAHYGYICDTLGADGDEVDVFVGPFPESRRVWVINQVFDGKFDETKCCIGFPDADSAKAAYVNSYTRDWTGFGSMVEMSMDQFKKWLKVSSTKPAVEKPVEKILWSGDAPRALTFDAILYQIRRHDADGLIFDAVTEGEVLQDAEEVLTLDAMTSPYQQLPKRAQLLMNMMNRVGDPQVMGFTVTKPYRVRGVINIAVIYALADGQTITVYFHTGGSNIRVQPDDELISWRWSLNKLDTSIAVAPEQGVELDLRTVARRIMQLAIKNSPTFAKQNAKKAETLASIEALKGKIVAAEMELADVQGQIAAKREEQRIAQELADAQVASEQAAESGRKLPTSAIEVLRSMGAPESVIRDAYPYDTFDAYAAAFPDSGKPIIAQRKTQVRNALRQLGWDGDMFRPLSLGATNATYVVNFTDRPDLRIELGRWTGALESGVAVYDDDLVESAEAMAKIIDDCAREDATNLTEIDEAARASGEPPVGAPAPEDVQDTTAPEVAADPTVVSPELVAALGDVAPAPEAPIDDVPPVIEVALDAPAVADVPPTDAGAPSAADSLLTYDLNFLQSVIDGTLDVWAAGLAERIESIMQAHLGNDELQAKAATAIDVYTRAVVEAGRASLDAIQQVPDARRDMPPTGQRANELEVETPEQKAAGAIAVRQQNGADWPTPVTEVPVPESNSFDTAVVDLGAPAHVITPPDVPVTPEQAVGESGGVPVPEAAVSEKLAEQPTEPGMPSIDEPVVAPALDTASSDVTQIEPTEANAAPAGLIQIQENGQSEPVAAEAKAEVGAESLATKPNELIQAPDNDPAPEIKPVPEAPPHPEAPAVVNAHPLPIQGDPSTPLEASPAGVPEAVTNVPPEGDPTTTQVPDLRHDTAPPSEAAVVDMPLDPAQAEAAQPNEVVRREADQAYLDSVIDGSERGESGRIGALFEAYEKDESMLDKWREAVAVFTARIKS